VTITYNLHANATTNEYVSQSCLYIQQNHITAATSVYVQSLGYSITVKFYTDNYATDWTVVSVNSATASATQYVTSTSVAGTDDDEVSSNTSTSKDLNAAILTLNIVMLLLLGVITFKVFSTTRSTPMSSQAEMTASKA
jgi:hypothetical protein